MKHLFLVILSIMCICSICHAEEILYPPPEITIDIPDDYTKDYDSTNPYRLWSAASPDEALKISLVLVPKDKSSVFEMVKTQGAKGYNNFQFQHQSEEIINRISTVQLGGIGVDSKSNEGKLLWWAMFNINSTKQTYLMTFVLNGEQSKQYIDTLKEILHSLMSY